MKGCLKVGGYIVAGILVLLIVVGIIGALVDGGQDSATAPSTAANRSEIAIIEPTVNVTATEEAIQITIQAGISATLVTLAPTNTPGPSPTPTNTSLPTNTPPPTDTSTVTPTPLPTDTATPTNTPIPANSYSVSGEAGWPELKFALKQVDLWPSLPDGKLPEKGLFVVLLGDLITTDKPSCLFKRNYELNIGGQVFEAPETNAIDSLRDVYQNRDDPASMVGVCPQANETRPIFLWFDVSDVDGAISLKLDDAGEIKIADSFGEAIAIAGLNGFPTATPAPTDTQTRTPEPTVPTNTPLPTDTPVPPTPAPVVGQDVLVGEVRWKILSAENMGNKLTDENQFTEDVTTSGKFIKVRFEIENRSKDMKTFAGLDLVDSQGREYKSASNVFMFIETSEACIFENLNPNIVKPCMSIYEVPADATGLKAYVGDLEMFGGDEAMIDLGI